MNFELFRVKGRPRGLILGHKGKLLLGLWYATEQDIPGHHKPEPEPDSHHLCDLCHAPAKMFCEPHAQFLCDGCVSHHQDGVLIQRSVEQNYPLCWYVSMAAYRLVNPLGWFEKVGDREEAS